MPSIRLKYDDGESHDIPVPEGEDPQAFHDRLMNVEEGSVLADIAPHKRAMLMDPRNVGPDEAPKTFGQFATEESPLMKGTGDFAKAATAGLIERTVEPIGRLTGQLPNEAGKLGTAADVMTTAANLTPAGWAWAAGGALTQGVLEQATTPDTARNLTHLGEAAFGTASLLRMGRQAAVARNLRQQKVATSLPTLGAGVTGAAEEQATSFGRLGTGIAQAGREQAEALPRLGQGMAEAGVARQEQMVAESAARASAAEARNAQLAERQATLMRTVPRAERAGEFLPQERIALDLRHAATEYLTPIRNSLKRVFNGIEAEGVKANPWIVEGTEAAGELRQAERIAHQMAFKNPALTRVFEKLNTTGRVAAREVLAARKELRKLIKYGRAAGDPDSSVVARNAYTVRRYLSNAWEAHLPDEMAARWAEATTAYRDQYVGPFRMLRTILADETPSSRAFDLIFNHDNPSSFRTLAKFIPTVPTIKAKLQIGAIEKLAEASADFTNTSRLKDTVNNLVPMWESLGVFTPNDSAAIRTLFAQPEKIPTILEAAGRLAARVELPEIGELGRVVAPQVAAKVRAPKTGGSMAQQMLRLVTRNIGRGTLAHLTLGRSAAAFVMMASMGKPTIDALRRYMMVPTDKNAKAAALVIGAAGAKLMAALNSSKTAHPQIAENVVGPEHDADDPLD